MERYYIKYARLYGRSWATFSKASSPAWLARWICLCICEGNQPRMQSVTGWVTARPFGTGLISEYKLNCRHISFKIVTVCSRKNFKFSKNLAMATAQKTKNGSAAATLAARAPWTDEQGIAVKVYEALGVTLEVIVLLLRMMVALVYSAYEVIAPVEPKSVKGEIVLITGAGHGMGREMALQYAGLGATVVCVDINAKGNQETVMAIASKKHNAYGYECDVSSRAAVMALWERVRREVGDVSVLVNNAGLMPCKPLHQQTEAEIRTMFEVNIIAHIWLTQAFLPAMKERNHGHIVAMSSMAGLMGLRNLVPYCASKFAVRGFMEALHEELREDPRDFSGIKFTCVYPYIVNTGLCKNPKIKFPTMMKMVSPAEAAEKIIDAMRKNQLELTIPWTLFYVNKMCRAFPFRIPLLLKDFLDSGLESHEDLE